jgi:hypothetical protein
MAYIYRHIRLDKNEPFYIGISSHRSHNRAYSRHGRNPIWHRIVAKTGYEVQILMDDISLDFAKKKEIEFIAMYGRIDFKNGTLCNITGGGDGMFSPTPERRDIIRRRNYGNKHNLGKRHSEDTKIKVGRSSSERNRGSGNPAYKGRVQAFRQGVLIGEYMGLKECAALTGANISCISSCLNGSRKSAMGLTFSRNNK